MEVGMDVEILLETDRDFQVLILSPYGWDYVGGLEFGLAV